MTGGHFVGAERKTEGVSDSFSLVLVTGPLDFIGKGLGSENYSNTNKFLTANDVKKNRCYRSSMSSQASYLGN